MAIFRFPDAYDWSFTPLEGHTSTQVGSDTVVTFTISGEFRLTAVDSGYLCN